MFRAFGRKRFFKILPFRLKKMLTFFIGHRNEILCLVYLYFCADSETQNIYICIHYRNIKIYACESESPSVTSNSLQPHGLYRPWNFPGQNTGVGSCSLLQGIFPTQGWNPGLLHCRRILYQLSHQGSPRILEWGAYAFSRGSS